MNNFQKDIDDRTNLTLSNRFELLLFRLGKSVEERRLELLGINVFKLRKTVPMPTFVRPAGMETPLLGMVNIRDQVIPVIDLPVVAGYKLETGLNILLITGYVCSVQAFIVELAENAMHLGWQQVHIVEKAVSGHCITSIVCLDDSKETNDLALVLDVEQILYDITPANHNLRVIDLKTGKLNITPGAVAIVVDDSRVARAMLEKGFNVMKIPHLMYVAGQDAREKIQQLSVEAQAEDKSTSEKITLVFTGLEMLEMDGFTPTHKIKTDERLKRIPVIIHSLPSGSANEDHVRRVEADGYVAKFEISKLSSVAQRVMDRIAKGISGPLMSRQLLS